jgi:hypothetical protein
VTGLQYLHPLTCSHKNVGIPSVDVPVKTRDPITGTTLNNTLKILNMFALVERNEPKYPSDEEAYDNVNDNVDIIRLHSVVQQFFVDTCAAENQISVWLSRASALFCQSFSIALQRINRATNAGLVEDFRSYEIHGQKLLDYLQRQARKDQIPSGWQGTLRRSLDSIKLEIEKRTGSLSEVDAFRVSIFDRTSSSNSSQAPSTPGQVAQSNSDIESIATIEDDIFSAAGSFSTESTVSSIRFTVIELIVRKFIEDKELSTLYEEAIKRMPNDRFVRNQRRLLKKFFLDLRPYAKTPIQEQAIRILRGRRERTSIAEQIWAIINPSNPSRHAQMAALLAQKPDKQSQLDRLLGEYNVEEHEQDDLSEESDNSDSVGSDEETKYQNVDIATEFLVGGAPFEQYKLNLRSFLRLDASPTRLQELIITGNITAVTTLLSTRFDEVAQLEFDWMHELLDIGCSFEEIARLLIDSEQASPWVLLDRRISITSKPSVGVGHVEIGELAFIANLRLFNIAQTLTLYLL